MSYLALYRKFRPTCFEDVRGQDHIVTTLRNQLKFNRIGHAYLFCGTRGTGKTSVARLFAKAVNCESLLDGNPCGQCKTCKNIESQVSMNIIEIDAASNNSVDDVRDIVEEVRYSPAEGKYKVYIIDEVHMLTVNAFNALLKTLEEPPSYVIFILATTEVHKLPITILSRCQRYDFKRITVDTIAKLLGELMIKEEIEVEEKALKYVAKTADGSLRDALSLLDQCISFYLGQKLTYENVLEVLGTVDVEVFARLLRYIRKGSVTECMALLDEIIIQGRDLTQFVNDFTWYIRNLLLAKTAEKPEEILEFSAERLEMMIHEAEIWDEGSLIRYIRILSELSGRLRYAVQKRLMVETSLIKLCRPEMETDYDSLIERVRKIEQKLESGSFMTDTVQKEYYDKSTKEPEHTSLPHALDSDLEAIAGQWRSIIAKTSPLIRTILINAVPSVSKDNKLMLVFDNEFDRESIAREDRMNDLLKAIASITGKSVDIELKIINNKAEKLRDYPDISKLIKLQIEYED